MSTQPAIRTDKLTKHYGNFEALVDLDLEVEQGEVFGYLGPNGAGKSTTIRTLLDLIRPTTGSASLMGLDSHRDSIEIRRNTGYLPGDLALYDKLTGKELLRYFANLRGGVDWKYVDQLSERFSSDLSRKIGDYSTGNRQKVGLIQAFMSKPRLLILDEPSTGLDPLVQQEFHSLVNEVSKDGSTVFLSSHTLSEVGRVADRVGIIRHGRMVVVETIDSLKAKAIRRIDIHFATEIPAGAFDGIDKIRSVDIDGVRAHVSFEGSVEPILRRAMEFDVLNLATAEADLEEIFLTYYHDETDGHDTRVEASA